MNYDPLNRALDGITRPVYPTDFSDVYSQYKEQYGKGAIGKLATALTGRAAPSQSGFARGSAEYKAADRAYNTARRQIERHVTGQYKDFSAAGQQKLKEIGETLKPIRKDTPGQGATIEITFRAPAEAAHRPRERTAIIEMGGPELFDYVNGKGQPEYYDLFDLWFADGGEAYGEDGAYEAEILEVSIS